ncbi:acetylglutamate kinase [Elizabethkingia argentiflava]|uniref:Acetylglutamate kinase n=1 Tax=Elizabethkingia argenteiflava TaxID=2681556 RepID=A0A845PUT3_9FLAO|nr:acetylglutamate kinase [Elizabethkingia argenteiflava]NAW51979.1 acetylglutamate kinase [Elizabethkingia argenteiflava]
MKGSLYIVKIGGNIIDDKKKLSSFLKDFSTIKEPKILVHGGGKIATEIAAKMQIPQQVYEGRRITDAETLKLVTMVYAGLINKNIVAALSAYGVSAIGLSGADANSVKAYKKPVDKIDFGFAGDIVAVNFEKIAKLLELGLIPVFCAVTHDGRGQLLNTNADVVASCIAGAMTAYYKSFLYYCFEKRGVLKDPDNNSSVIPEINMDVYSKLRREGKIFQGMIPKLDQAFSALQKGVKSVYILQGEDLRSSILNLRTHGTRITI